MIQQLIINGLIAGSIYALIAIGFTIIYRTVKFFHFAHGLIYTTGAYLAYSLTVSLGINLVISFFLASLLSGAIGIVIDRVVYSPLRTKKAPALVFLIASFGVFTFLQNLIQSIYGAEILTFRTGPVQIGRRLFGAAITDTQTLIILVSVVLSLCLWLFIQRTTLGKAMRAVADDPLAASIVGIPSEKIIMAAFAIGSVAAGAAGILVSLETNIEPTMGMNAILKGIVASIIGGTGSIPGALLGGILLGLIENLGIYDISSSWKDTISFVVLMIFLLIRPSGILGSQTQKERI